MKKETLDKALTYGGPLPEREIATDANLSLAALDNQMRASRDESDEWAMTADKLKEKVATRPPGFGIATLQLPMGLAEHYERSKFSEEDPAIVLA